MTQLMDEIVHVRFNGRSTEFVASVLDLPRDARDAEIKQAVARHLHLPKSYFNEYVVVHTSNTIIIRPEAIYG